MDSLTKIEKIKIVGLVVKAVTGVLGASLILTEHHPYLSILVLVAGASANEVLNFIKEREDKKPIEK